MLGDAWSCLLIAPFLETAIHPWRPQYIYGDLSHALHSCVGQRLRTVHGLPVWPSKCPMAGRCPQLLPIRPTLFPHHLSLERVPGTAILHLSLSPTCKSPRPSWASVDSLPIMLMSHKASEGRKQSYFLYSAKSFSPHSTFRTKVHGLLAWVLSHPPRSRLGTGVLGGTKAVQCRYGKSESPTGVVAT